MSTFKQAALASALMLLTLGAQAQEAYLTGGLGRAGWDFDCSGCNSNTSARRIGAGIRFNRVVALEAFYFDFGRARSSRPGVDGELRGTALGLETLLGWQNDTIGVAGKIGLASVHASFTPAPASFDQAGSASHTEVIGGLMASYRFSPQWSLRLDVDLVTVALDSNALFFSRGANVQTYLLGLNYHF